MNQIFKSITFTFIFFNLSLLLFEIIAFKGTKKIIFNFQYILYLGVSLLIFFIICYILYIIKWITLNRNIYIAIKTIFWIFHFLLISFLIFLFSFNLASIYFGFLKILDQQDLLFHCIFLDVFHKHPQGELVAKFTDVYMENSIIKANLSLQEKLNIIKNEETMWGVTKQAINYCELERKNNLLWLKNNYNYYYYNYSKTILYWIVGLIAGASLGITCVLAAGYIDSATVITAIPEVVNPVILNVNTEIIPPTNIPNPINTDVRQFINLIIGLSDLIAALVNTNQSILTHCDFLQNSYYIHILNAIKIQVLSIKLNFIHIKLNL